MLTHHRRPVCLSFVSTDLPEWSTIETAATLYQKDQERFHLLLSEPAPPEQTSELRTPHTQQAKHEPLRLLWLEISPYRVSMTMQRQGRLSYRHVWEQGVYGISRYWLHSDSAIGHESFHLRNYTRSLKLEGRPLPHTLRLEYELWSERVQLGRYILTLEIHH
jgi:hypothetical protein